MDNYTSYEENTVFALRSLYGKYGYSQYKMSKFEEYDFYVRNKDFLISDSIITFTDTNGRLMALKPDVTLSIVKSSKDIKGYVEKLYYNENVYRVSKSTKTFKEIMQVGLECIGDIDICLLSEVISLAAMSLKTISESSVLCVSHLGLLSAVFKSAGIDGELKSRLIGCISEKNTHELKGICEANGISGETADILCAMVSVGTSPENPLPRLKELFGGSDYLSALCELEDALSLVDGDIKDMIQIDFSVVSDTNYYNGIVFKGYIEGIPNSVLTGGQYDSLMRRMSKSSGAVGFAVYLDMLDPLKPDGEGFAQDTVILYDGNTDLTVLKRVTAEHIAKGERVSAQRAIPDKLTYKRLLKIEDGEVNTIENNA